MKYFFLALSISVSSISHSNELKIEEKKDFIVLCAISKSAEFFSKDKYFTDKAERIVLISSMIEKT